MSDRTRNQIEACDTPFVCDVCGRFMRGSMMSNRSSMNLLICMDCDFGRPPLPGTGNTE